jgi:putative transport protein
MIGSLSGSLAANPVLLLFVVVALGFVLGRVEVAGFSLGIAAVLFAGIAVGSLDDRFVLPEPFWVLGLALFVYTVGLASGPGFLAALRRRGLAANALVLAAVVTASLVAVAAHALLGLSAGRATGTFTGGETNTPALAAAIEALKQHGGLAAHGAEPIVGYSLTYPLGVALPLLVAWYLLRRLRSATPPPLVVRTAVVDRPAGTLEDVRGRHHGAVTFGRLRHEERLEAAVATLEPEPGDLVSVVGRPEDVDAVVAELGHRATDEIDTDARDLDQRRFVVSSRRVAGRRVGDVELGRLGATVTRLRRGDIDVVAGPGVQLELGDQLRVVAPRSRMREVAAVFGDSYRALGEIDALTFSVGIAAGLALGALSVPMPGGRFTLGSAGGPLIVGLVLGAAGRTGPFVWQPSYTAGLTVRQLGMVLFLAGIGLRSGPAFSSAIVEPSALLPIATGAAATGAALLVLIVGGKRLLRVPTTSLVGMVAGMQTQPAVLAYACDQLDDERDLQLGYTSVYPLAVIAKIVIAQVLVQLLV